MKVSRAGAVGAVVTSLASLFAVFHDKFSYTHEPIKVLGVERLNNGSRATSPTSEARSPSAKSPVQQTSFTAPAEKATYEQMRQMQAVYYLDQYRNARNRSEALNYLNAMLGTINNQPERAQEIGMSTRELATMMRRAGEQYLQEFESEDGIKGIEAMQGDALQKYMALQNVNMARTFLGTMDNGEFNPDYIVQMGTAMYPNMGEVSVSNMILKYREEAMATARENLKAYNSSLPYNMSTLFRFMNEYEEIQNNRDLGHGGGSKEYNILYAAHRDIERRLNQGVCEAQREVQKLTLEC